VPITVVAAQVATSLANFPYQVDLSSVLVSDPVFKGLITSASNIAVYDVVGGSIRPRIVSLDLVNNKLFITFDGTTTTASNKLFYICVGGGISIQNSVDAFGLSHYTNQWGFNEFSGSVAYDAMAQYDGTIVDASRVAGTFGNCVDTVSPGRITTANQIVGAGERSIEFIVKLDGPGVGACRICDNGAFLVFVVAGQVYIQHNGSNNVYGPALTYGNYYHIIITRTTAAVTNVYSNGVLVVGANQNGVSCVNGIYNFAMGAVVNGASAMDGTIDEFGMTNDIKTIQYAATRYNMFFNASFWQVGSGMLAPRGSRNMFSLSPFRFGF